MRLAASTPLLFTPTPVQHQVKNDSPFFLTGLGLGLDLGLAAGLFFFVTAGDFLAAGLDFLLALVGFGEGLFAVLARFCRKNTHNQKAKPMYVE